MKTLLYIFLGGGFGSMTRFLLSKSSHAYLGYSFPFGTLLSNILASLILGYLTARSFQSGTAWHALLAIGFCGGFSTFSTFSLDSLKLIQNAEYGTAILYIGLNLFVCLFAIWLGMILYK